MALDDTDCNTHSKLYSEYRYTTHSRHTLNIGTQHTANIVIYTDDIHVHNTQQIYTEYIGTEHRASIH